MLIDFFFTDDERILTLFEGEVILLYNHGHILEIYNILAHFRFAESKAEHI